MRPPIPRRPKAPDVGPRRNRSLPSRQDFTAFAIVLEDQVILRTPYNQQFVEDLKQIPFKLRAFVKEGRPLENRLRAHLEKNEDYFSSHEDLAGLIEALVNNIAASGGLSDSWVVALAAPELFEWAVGAALKQFPDLQLYDVRILDTDRE